MRADEFTQRRWVLDGAMATWLFAKGAAHPVELLNLSDPAMVLTVHREYLDAGAHILRTNSFGGPLEAKAAAVKIAREAGQALVAGVIGSTGGDGAREWFRECAAALRGVDVMILETFTDLRELAAAVEGVRDVWAETLIAQLSVERDGRLRDGSVPQDYGRALEQLPADVIGFNCSFGVAPVATAFAGVRGVTRKPISACPSITTELDFARGFFAAGALVVGACCGSTPEHIRAIACEHATLGSQWPRTS
jgi:methionine synthase I (cobalamin-dependent)